MWRRSLASSFMRTISGRRCEGRGWGDRIPETAASDGVIGAWFQFKGDRLASWGGYDTRAARKRS